MKKNLFILALLLCVTLGASAQKKFNLYAVGFYNQENLFDTCHDEGKRDYDFLPNGAYKWNGLKYSHKLRNMSQALADLGTDKLPGIGCAIIGLSEVENSKALDDLTAQEPLKARGYKYVHIEGPDRRGIDCALLYNPALFKVYNTKLVPYVQELKKDSAFLTRGFLTVSGELAGEHVAFIQKQRVAIARAMVNDPALILADEPTGALDSETSRVVMDLFHEMHEKYHKTIVLITHNPALAEECQRVLTLHDGRIIAERKGSGVRGAL